MARDGYHKHLMNTLIPRKPSYREMKTFQLARLIYDITFRFCNRFVNSRSRTHDQMVQAARSGVQNIAEGNLASRTSKESELKLTNVARGSLEELKLDYEDYLRQRGLNLWAYKDPRRQLIVDQRFRTADQFALWVKKQNEDIATIAANGALVLIEVACALLDRQISEQAKVFQHSRGYSEQLYRFRLASRRHF